jgi:hypothetical protein
VVVISELSGPVVVVAAALVSAFAFALVFAALSVLAQLAVRIDSDRVAMIVRILLITFSPSY